MDAVFSEKRLGSDGDPVNVALGIEAAANDDGRTCSRLGMHLQRTVVACPVAPGA